MINRLEEFLISLGFRKNEAVVYSMLVQMGKSSVLEISKATKFHRSNIYDALRSLVEKGLVYEINENSTKLFIGRSPDSLNHYIRQKYLDLDIILRDYSKKSKSNPNGEKIRTTKGLFALREAIFSLLEKKEPIFVYGIPRYAPELIGPILKDFHASRIKLGIHMNHIYNSDAADRVKLLNKMKYTQAKILPKKYDSNVTTISSGDKVIIFFWEEEITTIEINDPNLAHQYKTYFDVLWQKAKPI